MTLPAPGGGAAAVVNEKLAFEVRPSGGSFVSVSEIWLAVTETVQVVLAGSGEEGVSVTVVAGVALCPNDCGTPAGHSIENAKALAVTLSLKLRTMDELTGTLAAPFAGVMPVTDGAVSAGLAVVNEKL